MKHTISFVSWTRCFVLLVGLLVPLAAGTASAQELPHVPGELIAKIAEGADLAQLDAMLAQNGCVRNGAVEEMGLILVSFDPTIPVSDMAALLEAQDGIEFAEPNYLGEGGFVPNDTHFGRQWHHENTVTPGADIESVPAWDITRGDSSVVVAVLDTGIDSDHPEFAGRLLPGFDFVNNDSDPEDDHSHGTGVTGLLAANADNRFSVAGVDHYCSILPVKVLNQANRGSSFNLIRALNFAAGVDVISMSLIGYPPTSGLVSALQTRETPVRSSSRALAMVVSGTPTSPSLAPHPSPSRWEQPTATIKEPASPERGMRWMWWHLVNTSPPSGGTVTGTRPVPSQAARLRRQSSPESRHFFCRSTPRCPTATSGKF